MSGPALAPSGTSAGKNAPYGASLQYWLKAKVKDPGEPDAPEDAAATGQARAPAITEAEREERQREKAKATPIEIVISDASGRTIRRLRGTNKVGLNRIYWDLRYEPTVPVRLRTTPPGNPHVWEEKRFRGQQHRAVFYYGIGETRRGPLVAPGPTPSPSRSTEKRSPPRP